MYSSSLLHLGRYQTVRYEIPDSETNFLTEFRLLLQKTMNL
jgi:hypothetical protein